MAALSDVQAPPDDPGAGDAPKRGLLTFLRRMTIPSKTLAGYAVLALLSFSVVLYVLISLFQINRLNLGIVEVDIPSAEYADKMIDALIAQNGYEKRYVILHGGALRSLFWERSREFDERLVEMKRLSGGLGRTLSDLEYLHDLYGRSFETLTGLIQAKRAAEAQRLSQGTMNDLIDRMLGLLRQIPQQAQAARAEKMLKIGAISRAALRTTFILCAITTAVSIVAALLMTFSVTAPLRRLNAATRHIGEGKFDIRLRMGAGDEVSELSRAFEQMARRLKKLEEMYLDASPLTRLPGGVAIEREIQGRLDRKEQLALCVMDLDNFKAYNDRYGYEHGNIVIKEAARIVEEAARSRGETGDFVGHVGGDDFVVVTLPERVEAICNEVITQFDRHAPEFYSEQDRAAGYILGKTRQGVEMKFPLVTISIAVVTNTLRSFESPLEMAEVGAELKEYAKQFARSIFVVDKRRS